METVTIEKAEDFKGFATQVISKLPERNTATVIALTGDLGAGKTTFTQALAKELGVSERVVSPTFMIMRSYNTEHERFKKLVHIDAYRIEEERELAVLALPTILEDPETLVCIEWPEKVPNSIPADAFHIAIDIAEHNTRTASYG